MTTTDATTIAPIDHSEAMRLQATELERAVALLRTLDAEQWSTQTVCPDWDVRSMWLHVLGACEAGASMRENMHQMLAARKRQKQLGDSLEAGLSATQVAERADLSPAELVERLEQIAPKTVKGRSRTPRPMRALKIGVDAPVVEKWALGYLIDVIYLRDAWMHRVDTASATGADLVLTSDHDGRIVADVASHVGDDATIGIHCHDDTGCAVANSIAAVQAGARHVQGTLNGLGERTGNTNLTTVIPNLQLKMGYACLWSWSLIVPALK